MTDTQPNPPRAAHALLRAFVKPSDVESIPGDLLEEYREVQYPSLGKRAADRWYVRHVLSVIWRVLWPCVAAIAALRILTFPLPRGWNPSLIPAPGVSLLDAVIFSWAGYYASQRTGRVVSGIVASGVTSAFGFTMFFAYAAVRSPSLLLAPFEKPFIFVIVAVLLAIALTFAMVAGTVGAAVARRVTASGVANR